MFVVQRVVDVTVCVSVYKCILPVPFCRFEAFQQWHNKECFGIWLLREHGHLLWK